jgi:hypothetical protein
MPRVAREALNTHILSHFMLSRDEIVPATPDQKARLKRAVLGSLAFENDGESVQPHIGKRSEDEYAF